MILVVCSDVGLGGTSRSALVSGQAWVSSGQRVGFLCAEKTHPARVAQFVEVSAGHLYCSAAEVPWDVVESIHFHMSNYSVPQAVLYNDILDKVGLMSRPPSIIANNIFAAPDPMLDSWPSTVVTTVLGVWAQYQYAFSRCGRLKVPFVVPNPQSDGFFRLPDEAERSAARGKWGVDDERLVLRIGSPNMAKWSSSYIPLAEKLGELGAKLVLVGAPVELMSRLEKYPHVRLIDSIHDDEEIRSLYWAADVFALDASRGESFGNVIAEAILSGVPVVYRSREFRDNTPWELKDVPGFFYAEGKLDFLKIIVDEKRCPSRDDAAKGRVDVVGRYGVKSVGEVLCRVKDFSKNSPDKGRIWQSGKFALYLDFGKRVKIFATHNPVMSAIKQVKLKFANK